MVARSLTCNGRLQQNTQSPDRWFTAERKDLPTGFLDAFLRIAVSILFEADAGLEPLFGSLAGVQEEPHDLLCIWADCRSPGLEIILCIRQVLPVVLRHVRRNRDRIPLAAALSWMHSNPVAMEIDLHGVTGHTDADRLADQIVRDRILV